MIKSYLSKQILKTLLAASFLAAIFISPIFAAKFTLTTGKEFNKRIDNYLTKNNLGDKKSIKECKYAMQTFDNPIDISEDNDSSVLAYVVDNIIYLYSEENIYMNEDESYMFDGFENITDIELIDLDYSKTRRTNYMFRDCKYLSNLDIDNGDVIHLNQLEGMFYNCQSVQNLHLNMLDTNNVTNFDYMFYNCKNLKNIFINIDNWSTMKATSLKNMYTNCFSLKTNNNRHINDFGENEYKVYSRAGNNNLEGILKNMFYDYEDYGDQILHYEVSDTIEDVNKNDKNTLFQTAPTNKINIVIVIVLFIVLLVSGVLIYKVKMKNDSFDAWQ